MGSSSSLNILIEVSSWIRFYSDSMDFNLPCASHHNEILRRGKRLGTLELLMTRPLLEGQIVFAKYLGAISLIAMSLIPTLGLFG